MRIVFMGTPDFAVPTLTEIVGAGYDVVAAYTRAPRPAGRGMALRPSAVGQVAESYGLPVFTPASLRGEEEQAVFAGLGADVAVVVAYGMILPKAILDAPAQGCLNLHASLLPRWRGAAPIQRAVMAGDRETGVMVMRMEEGLDTGPVCLAERVAIGPEATAGDLHDGLARLGADLMLRALGALSRGRLDATPQDEDGVTYARKIDKAETRIEWSKPAQEVHDHVRGLSPFPGAWFELGADDGSPVRVKALRSALGPGSGEAGTVLDAGSMTIACGQGAVRLTTLQRAGKAALPAADFARGSGLQAGARLS